MANTKKPRETIALAKNKLYKTYQFHGIVGRGRDPEFVFKASISTVFAWLRDRFRQFDDIPSKLIMPEDPRQISDDMLSSFVIDDGYIIETVYIKEEGIWAFRLTEPDMGSSERPPAPGRLFLTNFSFRNSDGVVEFGCQLICAQPDIIEEDAEVFRPKLVRDLLDKFGLYSLCDIKYQAMDLSKASIRKLFLELVENEQRQMPIVILEKKPESSNEAIKIEDVARNMILKNDLLGSLGTFKLQVTGNPDIKESENVSKESQNKNQYESFADVADKMARKLAGYAYVFYNASAERNRTGIYYPGQDLVEDYRGKVSELIMAYPKRNELFQFGRVLFYSEAQQCKQNLDIKKLKESDDYVAENELLKDKIINLKKQIIEAKQRINDFSNAGKKEKLFNEGLLNQYQIVKNILEAENAGLKKTLMAKQYELNDAAERLITFESKIDRPDSIVKFIKWVETYYAEDIILLQRARDGLRKAKNIDFDVLCDAMEVLARDYKIWRLRLVSEEDYIKGCKSRCGNSFEIALCGPQNIKRFAEEYKIFYNTESNDKKDRRTMDYHLKCGVDNKFLVRIYFFWDEACSKVIIGSIPEHLSTTTGN